MAKRSAGERLRRLLAMVPWVVAAEGPTVEEVCRRFGFTEEELLADLDLVFCCGVHPFTPDTLIDVAIEDGRVWIRYADYFERPLRLTPEEGLALVAAGVALAAVPGADPQGPLGRALDKVASVLGISAGEALEVRLGAVPPATLDLVRHGVAEHRLVELEYYAYGRDEQTRRVVEPHLVFAAEGAWYLDAHCHRAGSVRRFRLDRITGATLLEERFTPPAVVPQPGVFEPQPHDPRVVLDLSPKARWVAEQYPVESLEELGDGALRVTLVVSERPWLERLLLRLGPDAMSVTGTAAVDGVPAAAVASGAAGRILARYDAG